jgi:hypothetical protein
MSRLPACSSSQIRARGSRLVSNRQPTAACDAIENPSFHADGTEQHPRRGFTPRLGETATIRLDGAEAALQWERNATASAPGAEQTDAEISR